ncbi:hypothetical protein K438DRAFT_2027943 [Mycena galopus ATCC 62051]|nr:hypothetical protein K438DRAFT_2027943 [Mycena galopus ATCC 62051]
MASNSSSIKPITLHFQNVVRIAGERIEGRVDLNEPLAREDGIEHLRIEMRGVVKTRIASQFIGGRVVITNTQAVSLFSSSEMTQTLWTFKSEQIGSDVVSSPSDSRCPKTCPRPFFMGKARPQVFSGSPRGPTWRQEPPNPESASESQLLARESLKQGWTGKQEAKIRQGFWGDCSSVQATLSLPELPSFPVSAPIPYTLHIITETKTLSRSDRPEKDGKPLFPAPPTQSSGVLQILRRTIEYTITEAAGTVHRERRNDTFDLQREQVRKDNTLSSSTFGLVPIPNRSSVQLSMNPNSSLSHL